MSTGTDKIEAARELRWFGNRLRGFLAAADDLEKLGSIENAVAEAETRVATLNEQAAAAQERIDDAQAKADEIVSAANTEAARLIEEANAGVAAAHAEADEIVAKANRRAEEMAATAERRAAEIDARTEAAEQALNDLTAEIADKTAKRDEIDTELKRLRARL